MNASRSVFTFEKFGELLVNASVQQQQLLERLERLETTMPLEFMSARQYSESRNIRMEQVLKFCNARNNGFPATRFGERNWQIDVHRADAWIRENHMTSQPKK